MSNFIDFTDPFWESKVYDWVPDNYTRFVGIDQFESRPWSVKENTHKFIVEFNPNDLLSVYYFNSKYPAIIAFKEIDWRLFYNGHGILSDDVPIAYKLYGEQFD